MPRARQEGTPIRIGENVKTRGTSSNALPQVPSEIVGASFLVRRGLKDSPILPELEDQAKYFSAMRVFTALYPELERITREIEPVQQTIRNIEISFPDVSGAVEDGEYRVAVPIPITEEFDQQKLKESLGAEAYVLAVNSETTSFTLELKPELGIEPSLIVSMFHNWLVSLGLSEEQISASLKTKIKVDVNDRVLNAMLEKGKVSLVEGTIKRTAGTPTINKPVYYTLLVLSEMDSSEEQLP